MRTPPPFLVVVCAILMALLSVQATLASEDVVVSMDFNKAPISQVFESLAAAANLNVVLDQGVQGEVTLTLREQPVMQAIALIARTHGLRHHIEGSTLIIASLERFTQGLVEAAHEVFRPRHVDVDAAAQLVRELFPAVTVIVDAPTGRLILKGLPDHLGVAAEFLGRYDVEQPRTLTFSRASVEEVLVALSQKAGWNLVLDGTFDDTITASLEGMEYVRALQHVADAADLDYRLDGNALYVMAAPEEPPAPIETRVVRLDYADPQKSSELVQTMWPELKASVDVPVRTLVLEGATEILGEAVELLKEYDAPPGQVLVEARVEEISVDAMRRLGIDWSIPNPSWGGSPEAATLTWNPLQLQTLLRLLSEQGDSRILASPKLAALDGEPARMLIGDRIPIIMREVSEDGQVTETLEFIEAGIGLEITPTVSRDGFITLDIMTEVSSITGMTAQNVPQIRTREAETRVRVRDGQPLVIGGLIQEEERRTMSGIPFLKDLPLLGRLFQSEVTETFQSETVIFLIPRIVRDEEPLPGEERGAANVHIEPTRSPGDSDLRVPDERSVRLETGAALAGAVQLEFEHRVAQRYPMTRLYVARGAEATDWGFGIGLRHYVSDGKSRPWVDVLLDRIYSANLTAASSTLTARVGGRSEINEHFYLEPYVEYVHLLGDAESAPSVPGRKLGWQGGLRLGWQY